MTQRVRSVINGSRIEVANLSCAYSKTLVVDDVTFRVEAGEHIAIVGANGSGKSTLLRSLVGLHNPISGEISLDGTPVHSNAALARQLCSWVPQRQAVGRFPLRVKELLASSKALEAAQSVAATLGVEALAQRQLSTLSGGQLQRVFIARAVGSLYSHASVLLADEPTAALDFEGQEEIAQLLSSLASTVVVVTHDRAMAQRCDRVFEMAAGKFREVAKR